MTANEEKSIYIPVLTTAALLISSCLSGSLSWFSCIIPDLLLLFVIIVNIKRLRADDVSLVFLLMLASGFLSIALTSADKQTSVHEFEKIVCLILAYYAGKVSNEKSVCFSIGVTGAFIAIMGLLAYCNIVRLSEFVFNDRKILRLQSVIKYANTAALMLACAYFAVLNCYKEKKAGYLLYISGCIPAALYLTFSKAAIPLFLVLSVVCALKDEELRTVVLYQIIITAVTAVLTMMLVKYHYNSIAMIAVIIGICVSGKIPEIDIGKQKVLFVSAGLLIFGVAAVTAAAVITKINLLSTFSSRMIYMKDALKLLKNNFISGIGPGGWEYYQYSAQSVGYSVKYIHNGWLQFWLENGIVFFAGLVFLIAVSIYTTVKNKRYIMLIMLLMIVLHSFVDINLSFGAVQILLGVIIGCIWSEKAGHKPLCPFKCVTVAVCIIVTLYMGAEFIIRNGFEKAYLSGDYQKALNHAENLEKICPYDSNLKISIAALDGDKTEEYLEKARRLSPLDAGIMKVYINYLIDNNKEFNISELTKHYISLCPKQEYAYQDARDMLNKAFEKGLCDEAVYKDSLEKTEAIRKQEGVIDRNELLEQMAGMDD